MTTAHPEDGAHAPAREALFGWSPPDLPAGTALNRRAGRLLVRTGIPAVSDPARGTTALGRGTGTQRGTCAAGCGPGAAGCGTGTVPGR